MNIEVARKIFLTSLIGIAVFISGAFVVQFIFQPRAEKAFGKIAPPKIQNLISETIEMSSVSRLSIKPNTEKIIYVYKKTKAIDEDKLAKSLGFSKRPKKLNGNLYWTEGSKLLKFKPLTSRFTYLNKTEIKAGVITSDKAVDTAKRSLKTLGLIDNGNTTVVLKIRKLIISGGEGREVGENDTFNNYSIIFGLKLGGFSLINESSSSELMDIWVGRDGSLRKIDADRQPLITTDKSTYELKSLQEAEKEIKEGKGKVVSSEGSITGSKLNITYQRAKLAYLLTLARYNYFYPVYVFEGLAATIGFKTIKITTLLPALED